ncbi:hypothetical protein CDES_04550 [Corynebacterium deserti GIMN1.010]|uniref:DUF1648 domain-containing protein n=1 Tax=Corynebacterium deserti GIMN1.010 TaxID=931089 RepID=A0A0M4CP08_9CORY|nr:hypothetical protein [Corynebacterium deserti]ALC05355.1 hypothetical protein CDES_04550 [Corynebacterium deserti GIMN1.010]
MALSVERVLELTREEGESVKPLGKIAVPWAWYLGIVGIIFISVAASITMLKLAPSRMPERVSSGLVMLGGPSAPPMTRETLVARVIAGALLILVMSVGVSLLISAQSKNLASDHPDASAMQLARRWAFLNNIQSCIGWFSFFLAAILSISSLRLNGPWMVSNFEMAVYVIAVSVLAWSLMVSIRKGQMEIDRAIPVSEDNAEMKWGIIYHNAADKRVFVELDDGQTTVINMARPGAWALVAVMILPTVALIAWVVTNS